MTPLGTVKNRVGSGKCSSCVVRDDCCPYPVEPSLLAVMGEQEVCRISDEELYLLKQDVLDRLRTQLVENIDPQAHFPYLKSKNVLSASDCDEINAQVTRIAKADRFVDIIARRGPKAYDKLCRSLDRNGTQTFLLRAMNRKLEELRQSYEQEKENLRQMHFVNNQLYPPIPASFEGSRP